MPTFIFLINKHIFLINKHRWGYCEWGEYMSDLLPTLPDAAERPSLPSTIHLSISIRDVQSYILLFIQDVQSIIHISISI